MVLTENIRVNTAPPNGNASIKTVLVSVLHENDQAW